MSKTLKYCLLILFVLISQWNLFSIKVWNKSCSFYICLMKLSQSQTAYRGNNTSNLQMIIVMVKPAASFQYFRKFLSSFFIQQGKTSNLAIIVDDLKSCLRFV